MYKLSFYSEAAFSPLISIPPRLPASDRKASRIFLKKFINVRRRKRSEASPTFGSPKYFFRNLIRHLSSLAANAIDLSLDLCYLDNPSRIWLENIRLLLKDVSIFVGGRFSRRGLTRGDLEPRLLFFCFLLFTVFCHFFRSQ